jgi:phage FluMu protein Com
MGTKWYTLKVGVDERTKATKVVEMRPGHKGKPKNIKTVNQLTETQLSYLLKKTHRCPRCGHLMAYIGLTRAKGIQAVVKACPRCKKRIGVSYLGFKEVRTF